MGTPGKEVSAVGLADFALALVTGAGSLLLRGAALHFMWGWFVSPLTGQPAPLVWHCTGLLILGSLFTRPTATQAMDESGKTVTRSLASRSWDSVFASLMALLLAFLLHLLASRLPL